MDINQIANILLSTLASLNIPGASFAIQYRRTSGRPIDATSTWKSLADATRYACNIDEVPYVPYNGQIISIEGDDSIYILVNDDTIPKSDGRGHFKLHKISTGEAAEGKYLSKLVEDTAQKLIHFLDGIDVVGPLSACKAKISDEISSVDYAKNATGWLINKEGFIEANKAIIRELLKVPELAVSKKVTTLDLLVQALADLHDLSVSHVATLMRTVIKDYVSSETFVSGFSGEGMKIYKALDGSWNMEIDNLTVRKIFSVFELVVQKMTHQGGMVIRSAAGAKLTKVTDGGSYWKCEHDSTDDFVKDDQVICQAFTGKSAKRYWRLVTSAGAGYFNLSKTDCETGSSSPEPGDDVAVLGNRTNTARQKAQIDCAIGDTAPYRDDYAGINSYSLTDKLITRTGELSGITDAVFGVLSGSGLYGTNVWLKGTFILRSGQRVEEAISEAENRLGTRITTVETNFEIREDQISSKVTEVTTAVTNAKKSETAAAGSASTAASKAGEASASAANAKKSADDATAKLVTITEKESSINQTAGDITLQVKEVTRKATEASGSASAAAGSASTAIAKAGEAATSATNAKKSADDASAKLVSITEKESSINQTASGITLQVKEVTAKASEATAAATNAKKSETAASGSATAAANSAGSAAASLQSVTTKESSINQTASKITLQVSEVTTKTDQATKAAELATAMSQGKMLYSDPTFASSNNGIGAYGTNNISVSRVNDIAGNPNDSGFCLKITATGITSNRWGGFYFGTAGKYNRVLVCRFIAKIPTGYNIVFATNSLGNGARTNWLTEKEGTGDWTEYACKVVYGSSGTISNTMFFALEGGTTPTASSPLIWYLCYATVFDLAASSTGDFVTKTVYDAGIKILKESIGLKVNTTTFNALGNRVTAAESAITVAQNAIEQRVTKTEYNKVGRLVAFGTNTDALATSYVMLNDKQINHGGRGFTLFKINRVNLDFTKVGTYDVYAGGVNYTNFINALNAIDANYIIVVISYEAIGIDTATANALAAYGGSGMTCAATRRSYVLVGQKGIGKGNGLEQWKQGTAGNVTISATIINGAVTGFFGGGNTASALTSAETRITQTENSIRLKADQTIVDGINTRLQSAEAKITPDAIKLTVKSQTETIAANAAKRTELWVDATGLDVTKYYPVTIGMSPTIPYIITVQRTLSAGYGKPSWSTHNEGFSVMCRWQSNGSGWGTIALQRTILDYAYSFANIVPAGSIGQITEASLEYIYVRGGSKYCVIVEGATGVNISLKTSAYTWTSGTTARTLDIKTEVTTPLVDLKQRPTTDTIKSQITLDGFGVSVFGKKIDFTGQVTFNSLNSSLQGTINDKATGAQVTAAQTAANNAQTTANTAKTNAATAQAAADAARSSATSANSLLSDIANDNKLTASEKQQTKKEWDTIVSEKTKNDAAADRFSVSKTAYGTAYTTLSNYITPLLSSLTTTSAITGTDFRAKFKAYYDARTDLLNAIAAKAKTLADNAQTAANNAQTTADTAKSNATTAQNTANAAKSAATAAQSTADTAKANAATAQSTANTAKSSAESANSLLADIANDNKLTPSDKQQAKKEWDAIVSEKVKNDAAADRFGVSKTAYGTAYSNLSTYVTPLLSSLTTTSAIAGTTFRANFKAYYDARTDLLNAISEKARTLAATAQSTADTAKNNASAAQTTANNVNTALNTLKTSLKGMAYQDMVTLAKLDTTIIEGGHIKTSLIDANAIVTGTLVAGIVSTTDITTGRLTVTTGAKIGGFKVEGDRLTSADAKGSLMIGDNMVRFFRINEYGTANQSAALLQIRNDKGSAVSLSGGANKTVLSIIGNGAYYAIESYGSHRFGQRQYEKWDAPGVLWAARITSGGGISSRWGNGCNVTSVSRTDTGNYVFWHDLGHTEYFIIATGVNENWTLCIISDKQAKTFTVKTFHKDQGWINSAFEVAIIGRNRTV